MNICLFCFSDKGAELASRLCGALGLEHTSVHSTGKYAAKYGFTAHESLSEDMGGLFSQNDSLVFIGACGIAVRMIAPYIKSKTEDPAVIVMDDEGKYVIPVLSGHIGGANALSKRIAGLTGAEAVITTATDAAGRFSCDAWAAEHGCAVSSMALAKKVSAEILTRDIPVASDFPLPESLPDGLVNKSDGDLGIYIGVRTVSPYTETLRLIPRIVILGIGCRRGCSEDTIEAAVRTAFENSGIDIRAICHVASVDIKKYEPGLLAFADKLCVPAEFYTAEELNAVEGDFEESEFVRQTVGTGSVCERAAVRAGGRLIIHKTATGGVTVAASVMDWGLEF